MNNIPSSSSCEDQLLELLVEGRQGSSEFQERLASCPECRQQERHFLDKMDEARRFLTPSSLQIQRIRAKVWEEIERKEARRSRWQPAWASAALLGLFVLLTIAAPRMLPPLAQVDLGGASLYASTDSLEVMADQLLPETEAPEPSWEQALSGGILEAESMEQIDNLLEMVIPDRGERT